MGWRRHYNIEYDGKPDCNGCAAILTFVGSISLVLLSNAFFSTVFNPQTYTVEPSIPLERAK